MLFWFPKHLHFTTDMTPVFSDFDVSWHLDTIKNLTRRAFYLPDDQSFSHFNTIKLTRKKQWCPSSFAFIKVRFLWLTPGVRLQMEYEIKLLAALGKFMELQIYKFADNA